MVLTAVLEGVGENASFHFYDFESWKAIFRSIEGICPGCSIGDEIFQGLSIRCFLIIEGVSMVLVRGRH